jgi:hypothetical protein
MFTVTVYPESTPTRGHSSPTQRDNAQRSYIENSLPFDDALGSESTHTIFPLTPVSQGTDPALTRDEERMRGH